MKRAMLFVSVTLLVLWLAACGGDKQSGGNSDPQPEVTILTPVSAPTVSANTIDCRWQSSPTTQNTTEFCIDGYANANDASKANPKFAFAINDNDFKNPQYRSTNTTPAVSSYFDTQGKTLYRACFPYSMVNSSTEDAIKQDFAIRYLRYQDCTNDPKQSMCAEKTLEGPAVIAQVAGCQPNEAIYSFYNLDGELTSERAMHYIGGDALFDHTSGYSIGGTVTFTTNLKDDKDQ